MTNSEMSILFCSSSDITFLQYLGKGGGGREGGREGRLAPAVSFFFQSYIFHYSPPSLTHEVRKQEDKEGLDKTRGESLPDGPLHVPINQNLPQAGVDHPTDKQTIVSAHRLQALCVHLVVFFGLRPQQPGVTLFVHEEVREIDLLEFQLDGEGEDFRHLGREGRKGGREGELVPPTCLFFAGRGLTIVRGIVKNEEGGKEGEKGGEEGGREGRREGGRD